MALNTAHQGHKAGSYLDQVEEASSLSLYPFHSPLHLFQESKTGMPNEYSEIEQTMSPKVLNLMLEWILERD